MILCYRLCSSRYSPDSGRGAALAGGRWNPVGAEVIYTAATLSLAVLEVLVHFSVLPEDYVMTEIHIPDTVSVEVLRTSEHPHGWQSPAPITATQAVGGRWINERNSCVLVVPSSIVATDRNYLINPHHKDFRKLAFSKPVPFRFDPRLK